MKSILRAVLPLLLAAMTNVHGGTLAQFRTHFGDINVELYPEDKPITVANFLRYVNSGAYEGVFIHRCEPHFVMQGGGFRVIPAGGGNLTIDFVPVFGTIPNEYDAGRRFSNTYGTIAMARVGGETNSATSQWFFNLNNNTGLDSADGGFTVFGRVVDASTNVLNVFTRFSGANTTNVISNASAIYPAFNNLPLLTTNITYGDLIYVDITVLNVQVRALTGGQQEISWNSVTNATNRIEYTTNMPPVWNTLISTNGTGQQMTVTDTPPAGPSRFYRVRVDF